MSVDGIIGAVAGVGSLVLAAAAIVVTLKIRATNKTISCVKTMSCVEERQEMEDLMSRVSQILSNISYHQSLLDGANQNVNLQEVD